MEHSLLAPVAASSDLAEDGSPLGFTPPGFAVSPTSVEVVAPDGSRTWLCSSISVVSLFRGATGTGWGRLIAVTDGDGMVHHLPVTDADLSSRWGHVLRRLVDAGLRIDSDAASKKELQRLLRSWRPPSRQISATGPGWVSLERSAFVFGSGKVIGDVDVLPLIEMSSDASRAQTEKGSLDDWRARVGWMCVGNTILLLAVSVALAGPLLDFLDLDLGGGLHLKGASSRGKSTALRVAASVWGSPSGTCSWRATANGLEALASSLNGTFLALDELGEVDGRQLNDALYSLANGLGKTRMMNGQEPGKVRRWRLSVLSTGEISVTRKLAEIGKRRMAGQMVRLLDVTADGQEFGAFDTLHGRRDAAAFADELKLSTSECYGTPAVRFIRELIARSDRRAAIRNAVVNTASSLSQLDGIQQSGVVKRVAERFALLAVAGELATRFDITGWPSGAALSAARCGFQGWHEETVTAKDHPAEASLVSTLQMFCRTHATEIVELGALPVGSKALGWKDRRYIYLPSETWQLVFPDFAGRPAALVLRDGGVLVDGDGDNLMRKVIDPLRGRQRYYTLVRHRLEAVVG